jgi:hypothetical protein
MVTTAVLAFRRVVGLIVGVSRGLVRATGSGVLRNSTVFADDRLAGVFLGLVSAAACGGPDLWDAVARNDGVHVIFSQLFDV